MEFKGTKGQWFVDGEHITTGYDNLSETICDINPNTEYPSVHERSVVESKYNAQLIAHAPEMLDMLKKQYDFLVYCRDNLKVSRPVFNAKIMKIEQLIKEATTI